LELYLLHVCAHLAAATRNKPLADILINRCLFRLQGKEPTEGPTDLFMIAAHACAAQASEPEYRDMLESLGVTALNGEGELAYGDVHV
jgi:hypothetical protein